MSLFNFKGEICNRPHLWYLDSGRVGKTYGRQRIHEDWVKVLFIRAGDRSRVRGLGYG